MRLILSVAALICASIATLVGFEIVEVAPGKTLLLTIAWSAWGLALHIASGLPAVGRFDARYGG